MVKGGVTVLTVVVALLFVVPAFATKTAQSSTGVTFATTELSVFTNQLPPGERVHLVTVFTADGEDYGYYLGSGVYTVPASGKLTVHVDLTDVKNGEEYESGVVHGWFYRDTGEPGYGPPLVEFTLDVS